MRFKLSAIFVLTTFVLLPAQAQNPPDCSPLRPLIPIPEIKSDHQSHILKATVILSDEQRALAGISTKGTPTCNWQQVRFFKGFVTGQPGQWLSTGDIIPGPTLRARVGDLVELTFLNQVDPRNFPNTLDRDEKGDTAGCDISTGVSGPANGRKPFEIYPRHAGSDQPWAAPPWGGSPGDVFPNCLHGSSTANLHYHGTHTTPSTTGDNVLLFIRPALRAGTELKPADSFVNKQFGEFFKWCEEHGPPQEWTQLPGEWQDKQKELLQEYDRTAPYKGVPGNLPQNMKLWPANEEKLNHHPPLWPQYSIGAYPYCFRLPALGGKKYEMYQAPGTHWYHAHKHGSTALNVGNGMTGAFIIEGAYDDSLKKFYEPTPQHKNWGLEEQVLVIQLLETALNLLSPTNRNAVPPLSVNGRLDPLVTMKPNQVQLWRIVNGAARTFVQFDHFEAHGPKSVEVDWRQIAQDGVQFEYENYQRVGTINNKFNLAAANRADLLVRAPSLEGDYDLKVVTSVSDVPSGTPITLLTVRVKADDKKIDPPMDFIHDKKDFPVFPSFLADIYGPFQPRKPLTFNTEPSSGRRSKGFLPRHTINDKLYQDGVVYQQMTLNTMEEWTLINKTANIAHPFHIHINPFQIVEVFQPNTAEAQDPRSKCYANPTRPATWKACKPLPGPWVWWDTFAIPTARNNDALVCSSAGTCPSPQGTACQANTQVCTVSYPGTPALTRTLACTPQNTCQVPPGATMVQNCNPQNACTVKIPGYFKMRSRFADFTGEYVLHCHILAHEDRGMMELVAVTEKGVKKTKSDYTHH